ncbi:MAG TPA: c-type cytochrome [Vicinamibacterales bacterium]|nr:c-type cytochrome [Vicinamibacterales bacterium]
MRHSVGRTLLASFVILNVVAAGVVAYARQGQQGGQAQVQAQQGRGAGPPQNLKVLPKNWSRQQVQSLMNTFASSLGVQCTHCHAGTPPQLNYAADEKPTKEVARKMIHMVMHINEEHLKGIGSAEPPAPPAAGAPPPLGAGPQKVSCFTCHRGQLKPLTAPASGGN